MTTIKSYTDIEQSSKLAEILPIESADMKWFFWKEDINKPKIPTFGYSKTAAEDYKDTKAVYLPAWSLAALLSVLPRPSLHQTKDKRWYCNAEPNRLYFSEHYNNPVDACYNMILKLNELNLL